MRLFFALYFLRMMGVVVYENGHGNYPDMPLAARSWIAQKERKGQDCFFICFFTAQRTVANVFCLRPKWGKNNNSELLLDVEIMNALQTEKGPWNAQLRKMRNICIERYPNTTIDLEITTNFAHTATMLQRFGFHKKK